jgi:hypothetical protein
VEGRFLDKVFGAFELDLPRETETMDAALKFILPRVQPWSEDLRETKFWLGKRWLEIPNVRDNRFEEGTDAWAKRFINIFMDGNEHLVIDNGVVAKKVWRVLGNALILDEGKNTILYDLQFLNDTFMVLKQNGTDRYFVLGAEKFVEKIKFDWRPAMEELFNVYRNNSKFSLWVMALITLVVLFLVYLYS